MIPFLWRNMKWRFHNSFTIVITILQPMLWLILYSTVANASMQGSGIANYTAFILPGLIVLVSFGCCSSSGIMNYLMKKDGSFYRVMIAPVNRGAMILGQLLEAVICTFLEVAIMIVVSVFFSVRINCGFSGLLIILLLVFLSSFFIAGLAYAISLSLPNEIIYETVMNAIVLPVFFLSTALFPYESLTGTLKTVIGMNPFTQVINVLRSLILDGTMDSLALCQTTALFIILCACSFAWAYHKVKKETSI